MSGSLATVFAGSLLAILLNAAGAMAAVTAVLPAAPRMVSLPGRRSYGRSPAPSWSPTSRRTGSIARCTRPCCCGEFTAFTTARSTCVGGRRSGSTRSTVHWRTKSRCWSRRCAASVPSRWSTTLVAWPSARSRDRTGVMRRWRRSSRPVPGLPRRVRLSRPRGESERVDGCLDRECECERDDVDGRGRKVNGCGAGAGGATPARSRGG